MNSAAPSLDRTKIACEDRGQLLARRALIAEPIEEQLVQDHRIGGDQLLALQSIDEEARRAVEVEVCELLGDEVEALHRPAVVVLVVADDQLLGHALDVLRIAAERLHFV